MAPIKIYSNAPITAAKADGVTPKTATPDDGLTDGQDTQTAPRHHGLPEYVPAYPTPTRTTNTANYGPPPPQPGAVPHLPAATATSNLPPPPRASSSSAQQPPFPGITQPPQMSIPPPAAPYTQRGTMPGPGPGPGQSTNIAYPAVYQQHTGSADYGRAGSAQDSSDLSHPPGYQQRTDPSDYGVRYDSYGVPNRTGGGGGGGGYGGDGASHGGDEGNGVWGFLQAAGKKLSDAETEVWRRINKE